MPGLYFKYDVSALKVIVKQDQEGFMHFLIRISSVIAGIIVISGMVFSPFIEKIDFDNNLNLVFFSSGYLNSLIQLIFDFFIRKISPQTYEQLHNPSTNTSIDAEPAQQTTWQPPNHLISNANQMAEENFNFTIKQ